MKILCIPTLNAPVVHYRMVNFVNGLRKLGHEVAFSYWNPEYSGTCEWENELKADGKETDFIREIDNLCNEADIIIFQALHTRAALALLLALQHKYNKKTFLSEFDDDIYAVNSDSPSFANVGPGTIPEVIADEQIVKSHGVVVSTDYLKKRYKPRNDKVDVIPNCLDFDIWDKLSDSAKNGKVKIGWEGGFQHKSNLRLIKNVVHKILDEFPNVYFHFKYGGYQIDYLKHERIIFDDYYKWVGMDKWPQVLKDANFDIGIAPLRDLDANRSKSNLRWLEYSALKVPTVASDVGPYRCIKQGETGILAKDEKDWIEGLRMLIKSKELRMNMGNNAYKEVKSKYNVDKISKKYEKVLSSYVNGGLT